MTRAFAEGGREDVGLQLALIYEDLGKDAEAGEVYRRMLSVPRPTINVRVRADRYFARLRTPPRPGGWARPSWTRSQHPAGLFLRAEVLASQGKYADAVRTTPGGQPGVRPQYWDGLGRPWNARIRRIPSRRCALGGQLSTPIT
jgi:hypothetical protein